jgi:conjugative relaxase-like TrwC/TraI family protein
VLSIAKLSPGQEAYYESSVAQGLDDYYAGRGESPGVWHGGGAAGLGLLGVVADGDLGRLMRGVDPATQSQLRAVAAVRLVRVGQLDAATGERRLVERELRPVAGFDLVFSAPKSVSLLHALGDERVRFETSQAHQAAWQAAFSYLEETACVTRRGRNGVVREWGAGFVASAFAHRTSRALDPHLHTHVIVANTAQSADGKWRALDGDLLLRTHRLAAGSLYQAQLRYELTARLGVDWQPAVKGMAEIRGVSDAVLRAFSTRRAQVVAHLAEHATEGWRAAQVAAIATRDAKSTPDLLELRGEWEARAAALGFGPTERHAVLGRAEWRTPLPSELRAETRRLLGEEGLCEMRASFNEADLVAAWAAALPHGASARRVRALASGVAHDPRVLGLDTEVPPIGVPKRYTTRQLAEIERDALSLALDGRASGAPTVNVSQAGEAIDEHHPGLSAEQRAMVTQAVGTPDRVVCVVGHAGAGKTTGMSALHDVLTREGVRTLGAAPSGVAAEKLEQKTGIPSSTLHRLARQADRAGLPHRSVVVVDEAAMADTRTLHRLLDHATRADGKVILVGDGEQLGAVGPGGLFASLVEQLGATSLTANHRQHHPAERDALRSLRDGAADDFLAYAAKAGRLTLTDTLDEARAALLADWHTARQGELDSLMIAYRRVDVETLNYAARSLLRRDDQLGADRHTTPEGRSFAIGDQVICLHNAPTLGVANGTRGELIDISRDGLTLRTPTGDRQLPTRYADDNHLAHGYAITGHKSQGQTVSCAFVLAPGRGDLKEWAYVVASRARDETRIYLAQSSLDDEHEAPAAPVPDGDALDRLATAARRPANEPLATSRVREPVAPLIERHETLKGDLARAQRAERNAERALDMLGPIRRHTRGPRLSLVLEDAQRRTTTLTTELAQLERSISTRQAEIAERVRDRRLETPTRARALDHSVDLGHGIDR